MRGRSFNNWEGSYLALCEDVLRHGYRESSRAGDVYCLPGLSQTISLPAQNQFPLLTTRRMFVAGILGEAAAFLRGSTSNGNFLRFGCKYWTPNARAAYPGLEDLPDDVLPLGPIYGAQWRNFNGQGVDQLDAARRMIVSDPHSRRIIVTAWNPLQTGLMCLPPCHVMFQFHVMGDELHLTVYMRSVDLCLGLPSDIVLYYLILALMAYDTRMPIGSLTFQFGNAHIYAAHVQQLEEQLGRTVGEPPVFNLIGSAGRLIDNFVPTDIMFHSYNPQEKITYELFA